MIKICFISGSFPIDKCGVGDYTYKLCKSLIDAANVDISVITSSKNIINDSEYITSSNKEIHKIKIYNKIENWRFNSLVYILKIIDKIKPDIVHIQYPTAAYGKGIAPNLLPLFLKLKKCKVVTTFHEYSIFTWLGKLRLKGNILFSDSLVVVDSSYINDINAKKINYINIGSNINKSRITEDEIILRRSEILDKDNKCIMGYFGFITKTKGLESILKAMKYLKNKNMLKSKLLILGELKEKDEYHRFILKTIKELNLTDNVIVKGYLENDEVANNLRICDFVALPFVDGVSPKNGSMLAAIQEGRKVITTRGNNINEKINNLYYIEKYDDIEKLSEIINSFQNEEYNNKVEVVDDKFSWENIALNHISLYKKIIKNKF